MKWQQSQNRHFFEKRYVINAIIKCDKVSEILYLIHVSEFSTRSSCNLFFAHAQCMFGATANI